jgi:HTH-type transcriptional regulator/antitoxin HigA
MEFRLIRNSRDHADALREIERLWNAPDRAQSAERLEGLTLLVQAYEAKHLPHPDPDPIDVLLQAMQSRGLSREDVEPYLGSRECVAEILDRKRPLSLEMIRLLAEGLGIAPAALIRRYETRRATA